MDLMVEFLGVCQLQLIFHVGIMPNTLEKGKHQMLTRSPCLTRPFGSQTPRDKSAGFCLNQATYP